MRKNLITLENFINGNVKVNIITKEFGKLGGAREIFYKGLMKDIPKDLLNDLNKDYKLAYFDYSSVTHEPQEYIEITFFRNKF